MTILRRPKDVLKTSMSAGKLQDNSENDGQNNLRDLSYYGQFSGKRVLLKLLIHRWNGLLLLLNSIANGISLIV